MGSQGALVCSPFHHFFVRFFVSNSITVAIARPIFPEVLTRLQSHFTVLDNQEAKSWSESSWRECLLACDGVLTTMADPVNAKILAGNTRLKIAANMAVGFNNFNLPELTQMGIMATNTPDVLTQTTADLGFALLMACARRMSESERYLRAGSWKTWRYDFFAGAEVHGSTLGILGMGRIGQAVAKRARLGFDMQVLYHNRTPLPKETELALGAEYVSREELLERSDHLMLVLPYSPEVHHLIGAQEIARMKPGSHLINIARGGIVDEDALVDALESGHLAGAALDVYENEPQLNPRLLTQQRMVLTPHIASASLKTRLAMAHLAADNLVDFFSKGRVKTPLNAHALKGSPL
jgi:glyoxylate/hydroxypyruvate/2-ketogluconate reductase